MADKQEKAAEKKPVKPAKAEKRKQAEKEEAQAAPEAQSKKSKNAVEEDQKEAPQKKKRSKKKSLLEGRIYIYANYNNTIVTITNLNGDPVCWSSAGACGFKGTRKSTPYASQVAAEKALEKGKLLGLTRAHVYVRGAGIGRDQALRALASQDIDLQSVTDLTALPHGGVRPRKPRRV